MKESHLTENSQRQKDIYIEHQGILFYLYQESNGEYWLDVRQSKTGGVLLHFRVSTAGARDIFNRRRRITVRHAKMMFRKEIDTLTTCVNRISLKAFCHLYFAPHSSQVDFQGKTLGLIRVNSLNYESLSYNGFFGHEKEVKNFFRLIHDRIQQFNAEDDLVGLNLWSEPKVIALNTQVVDYRKPEKQKKTSARERKDKQHKGNNSFMAIHAASRKAIKNTLIANKHVSLPFPSIRLNYRMQFERKDKSIVLVSFARHPVVFQMLMVKVRSLRKGYLGGDTTSYQRGVSCTVWVQCFSHQDMKDRIESLQDYFVEIANVVRHATHSFTSFLPTLSWHDPLCLSHGQVGLSTILDDFAYRTNDCGVGNVCLRINILAGAMEELSDKGDSRTGKKVKQLKLYRDYIAPVQLDGYVHHYQLIEDLSLASGIMIGGGVDQQLYAFPKQVQKCLVVGKHGAPSLDALKQFLGNLPIFKQLKESLEENSVKELEVTTSMAG